MSFKCSNCKGSKFVLTENTLTTLSVLVNTISNITPEINTNTVLRQYTLICVNCGKVYSYTESEQVDLRKLFNGDGILIDIEKILTNIEKKGTDGNCNV